jgi:hypothetical protein
MLACIPTQRPARQFGQTEAGSWEIGHHDAASASTHDYKPARMSSANLPQFMWGDPANAYERIEGATCRGCGWIIRHHVAGERVDSCGKGRRIGVKCKHYEEGKNAD